MPGHTGDPLADGHMVINFRPSTRLYNAAAGYLLLFKHNKKHGVKHAEKVWLTAVPL